VVRFSRAFRKLTQFPVEPKQTCHFTPKILLSSDSGNVADVVVEGQNQLGQSGVLFAQRDITKVGNKNV